MDLTRPTASAAHLEDAVNRHSRKNLTLWVVSVGMSLFGDAALWLVAVLWIRSLTGSDSLASLSFLAYLLPGVVAPLLASVVDRVRRRRFLVGLNAVLAAVSCLAFLVQSAGQVWLIFVVLVATGAGTTLHGAAEGAILRSVVPPERIGRANAILRTVKQVSLVAAPAIGTAVYIAAGPEVVIAVQAGTFVVAGIAIGALRMDDRRPGHPTTESVGRELTAGFRFVWQTRHLRQVTLALLPVIAVFGLAKPMVLALTSNGLGLPVTFVGLVETGQALGAILGALASIRLVDQLGPRTLVFVGLLLFALG